MWVVSMKHHRVGCAKSLLPVTLAVFTSCCVNTLRSDLFSIVSVSEDFHLYNRLRVLYVMFWWTSTPARQCIEVSLPFNIMWVPFSGWLCFLRQYRFSIVSSSAVERLLSRCCRVTGRFIRFCVRHHANALCSLLILFVDMQGSLHATSLVSVWPVVFSVSDAFYLLLTNTLKVIVYETSELLYALFCALVTCWGRAVQSKKVSDGSYNLKHCKIWLLFPP